MHRSRGDRVLAGVCGGLGEYLNISPVIIRTLFVILALTPGVGIPLYLLLWAILPYAGQMDVLEAGPVEMAGRARAMGEDLRAAVRAPDQQTALVVGVALVVVGIIFLLQTLHVFAVDLTILWPVVLILAGLALVWRRVRGG